MRISKKDIVILLFFLAEIFFPIIFKDAIKGLHVLGLDIFILALKFATLVAVLISYGGFLKKEWGSFKEKLWLKGLICIAGAVGIFYILKVTRSLEIFKVAASGEVVEMDYDEEIFDFFTATIPMLGIVFITSFAPLFSAFTEEIIFRHMLFYKQKKGLLSSVLLLVISSALFGLIHYFNFNSVIATVPYMVVALYFGLIYLVSGNIWYSITIHFINNFVISVVPMITLLKTVISLRGQI